MNNEHSISVVIPLYNKGKSISNTLGSVIKQSYTDYEIIVVDDGSTDNSALVVESFNDSRIRLIRKENGGVCSARNRGIKESKGEFVAFLDADDLWDSNYLREQVNMIGDFPECDMWSVNYVHICNGEIYAPDSTGLPAGFRGRVMDYFNMKNRISDLCCSSSVVVKKRVFDIVGTFDERIRFAEDDDMWWRIIAHFSFAFNDKVMVYYCQDAENRAMSLYKDLRCYLPFYVDKYQDVIFKRNTVFYTWINRWCAVKIKHIYFGDSTQREDSKIAIRKLDMSVLPLKYRLLFGLPFSLAKVIYLFDERRMKL